MIFECSKYQTFKIRNVSLASSAEGRLRSETKKFHHCG